ncbi:hypothetical protein CDG60_02615 [Acinetobacter chinensis]|uniref:Uncharacterized protein n=1 Tax=Acinetobacter chinensis TaxID=2004650 RepID=A0A3B7LUF9_9GAMM|nr:hypothetical protein [Acinetobacter chinensis]AXY55584.1 hypothetical protein CDG60_02615 [Acinetobacter chinensis]
MSRYQTIKHSVLAIAIGSLITACGGGGGGGSSNPSTPFTPKTVSGVAVDFYLNGSTVTFDDCNGVSTTTGAQGTFSFTTLANCTSSALTIRGGTDIVTGQAFTGTLKVKKTDLQNFASGKLVASPLTSLEYYLGSADLQTILNNLGITSVTAANISTFDPVTAGTAKEMAAVFVLQQLATQIEDSLQAVSKGDGSTALTQDAATKIAFESIVSILKNQNTALFNANGDLQTTVLANIVDSAVSTAETVIADPSTAIDTSVTDQIQTNITTVSDIVQSVTANGTGADLQSALVADQAKLNEIKENLKTPVYSDFSLGHYSLADIKASTAAAPLNIDLGGLQAALSAKFKLDNTKSELTDTIKLGFKVVATRGSLTENIDISISNLRITFNTAGDIISATVPKDAVITLQSSLKGIQQTEFVMLNDKPLEIQAGAVSLYSIISNTPTLQGYYNQYFNQLAVGDVIATTAYVLPITYVIDPSLGLGTGTFGGFTGASVTGYLKLN